MNTKVTESESIKPFLTFIILILFIWGLSSLLIALFINDWSRIGSFGDMFGAVGSLFSGLAFAGVIYTILLQRKELALQRQELVETRKELARSAQAQEQSEKALSMQVTLQALTARLNSLSIMITYNTQKAEREKSLEPMRYFTLLNDCERYAVQIESIMNEMNRMSKDLSEQHNN